MDCLYNYIGLDNCNEPIDPESGLYINSLPGISQEILQKIANSEQGTFSKVWESVQKISGVRFYTDAISKLRQRYTLKNVRGTLEYKPIVDLTLLEASAAEYRGMHIKLDYAYQTFQAFTLAHIFFVSASNGSSTLTIFDGYGKELYTKEVQIVEGLNLIYVNKTFVENEIYIGVEHSGITGVTTEFTQDVIGEFCGACHAWSCDPTITGFTKDGIVYTETGRNTHGLGLAMFMSCDYKSVICNNKELFASPWLFLLGSQLMTTILSSPRTVQATTVDRTKYEELRDFYQVEYEKALTNALAGYYINVDEDCCIECNSNPKRVEWRP